MHKVQVHSMISSYVQIDIAEEKVPIPHLLHKSDTRLW